MVTLKEHDAVEYLRKAKSCINPADNFSNLQLVKTMLAVESAFIQRLSEKDPEMARVSISASGFPELDSWFSDIQSAFQTYDQIKLARAKLLTEPFKQFLNLSFRGIIEECAKACEELPDDYSFANVFAGITAKQRVYLERNWPKSWEDTPPLMIDPKYPGLLFAAHIESPFQPKDFDPKATVVRVLRNSCSYPIKLTPRVPQNAGLKYFDSAIMPFVVYFIQKGVVRVLMPGFPMLNRSGKAIIIDAIEQDEHGHDKVCQVRRGQDTNNDFVSYKAEYPDVSLLPDEPIELEKKFAGIHPGIMNAVLNIETVGFQRLEVDRFINLLPDFDSLAKDSFNFLARAINGTISNDDLLAQSEERVKQGEQFFNSIGDNNLRIPLQLAFAEILEPLKKELDWGIKVTEVDPRRYPDYTAEMDMEPHKEIVPKQKRRRLSLPWF